MKQASQVILNVHVLRVYELQTGLSSNRMNCVPAASVCVHRSDCVDILTQCGDMKRFHEGQTPERICELLSPIDDPERCIPLHRYLSESLLVGQSGRGLSWPALYLLNCSLFATGRDFVFLSLSCRVKSTVRV